MEAATKDALYGDSGLVLKSKGTFTYDVRLISFWHYPLPMGFPLPFSATSILQTSYVNRTLGEARCRLRQAAAALRLRQEQEAVHRPIRD